MPLTRRQTLVGFGQLLVGAGTISSGAFGSEEAAPSADFRIVADSFRGLEFRPGRDDESYVETDEDGLVTNIVLATSGSNGISKGAKTGFANIVEIHKLPTGPPVDELYFEFEVSDDDLDTASDPTPSEIEDALFIEATDGEVPGDGSHNYLAATEGGDAHNDLLSPNQHVPFGIGVDLLTSGITDLPAPERFSIELHIRAEHLPQGPPGGTGG